MTICFGEKGQRPLPGGAVEAVAGLSQYPLLQLAVGIGKGAEVPEGKKVPLDVFRAY